MKTIENILIQIYKKYGYFFQGKIFSALILFYKYKRVIKNPFKTLKHVLGLWPRIKTYGGSKDRQIDRILCQADFDSEQCKTFIYTWDICKSVKMHGKVLGNCTIDYRKILDHSLSEYYLEGTSSFAQKNNRILDSILNYFDRLAKYVADSDIPNKENIVLYISRMNDNKAESLEEALQRILLINQLQWQLGHILVGIGRLDVYMERFECDSDKARILLTEFFELLHKYHVMKSNALMGDTGQICIVGGLQSDGTYFHGRYTDMIVDIIRRSERPDPKVLIRISNKIPTEQWNSIVDAMMSNVGSPLLSNDDVIIPALIKFGYESEDAYNYITSACWEPLPGESFEQNNIVSLNYLQPFEYISQSSPLDDIHSMEELVKWYEIGLQREVDRALDYLSRAKWEEDPLYSMFTEAARASGKDVALGGAKYNNYGFLTVGMSNAINALLNINRLVFEDKEIKFSELDRLRKDNYKGRADIVAKLKANELFFGTDEEQVLTLTRRLAEATERMVRDYRTPLGGRLKFGLSSPHYIMSSVDYPASFDGREKGQPFGVHISSGRSLAYTELLNFASGLDYTGAKFNGNVVDFIIAPDFVKRNRDNFVQLIRTAFAKGVSQLQTNVIDSKILIAAKNDPDAFPNLIVRVWGFNAYFNELPEEYKDYLIERALQSENSYR